MAETDSRILEYLEEGLFLYGVGKVQESIVRWRKVLELDPRNERAMDYIESAGGDVSQFRQKAGLPARGGSPAVTVNPPPAAPSVAPPPPAAAPPRPPGVATLPMPNVTAPNGPLDVGAFLESTGTAPPRPTLPPASAPMPWATPPSSPPAMPSLTTSQTNATTVPSAMPTPPMAAPAPPAFTPPPLFPPETSDPFQAAVESLAPPPPVSTPQPQPPVFTPPPAFNPPPPVAPQPPPVVAPQPPPVVAPPQPPPAPAAPAAPSRAQLIAEAGTLFQAQQFELSLELLERIAREHPPVDDPLRTYLDAARNALYEVLKVQWPRPDLIPEIRMSATQVMQLKLSPEAGFIFSRVDGVSTVEEILAMGGLDPFTTLRALSQLLKAGVIGVQS